jgi:hypothetical protein
VGRERRGDRGVGKSSSDEPENGRGNGYVGVVFPGLFCGFA